MITIPLKVSEELAGRLLPLQNRLPEIIELGLRQLKAQSDVKTEVAPPTPKERVLAALASTGIVSLPEPAARSQPRDRHTPIPAGGQLASELIIEARGAL
ncbi:MAG: hypothetical protein JXA14_04070 [Anaerolineae bacterium]|nr:hypothetical protein [Anaerolineae bacterium]